MMNCGIIPNDTTVINCAMPNELRVIKWPLHFNIAPVIEQDGYPMHDVLSVVLP